MSTDEFVEKALKRYGQAKPSAMERYVREGLNDLADLSTIDARAWIKDEFSNMDPTDILEMLDAIKKLWDNEMLDWIQDNVIDRNNPHEDDELRWA